MYQEQFHHHIHFLRGKKTKPELSKNVWSRTGGQPGGLVQSLHNRWKGRHLRVRVCGSRDKISLGFSMIRSNIPVSPSAPLWTMHPLSFWQASSPPPSPPASWSWAIRSCFFPSPPGVNKKSKKFKTVWHGFQGILKLSGRVNQASLKLSAGFSNTVCLTS